MVAILMIGYQMIVQSDSQVLTVEISGQQIGRVVLSWDELNGEIHHWHLEGPAGGLNLVYLPEKGLYVESSSCPDHICIKTGWINKAGQSIVCVPNEIIVRLFAGGRAGKDELDGILR